MERTALAPGDGRARLESAVEMLRREWRGGCRAGNAFSAAEASVRRLRDVAASEQIAREFTGVLASLDAYRGLPVDRRPAKLKITSDALSSAPGR